jgi:biotin synthase
MFISELKELIKELPDYYTINIKDSAELTKDDLKFLLSLTQENDLLALYSEANIIRKASIKDHVCIHGIIEFSNYCKNDCHYCGLRKSNTCKELYRMSPEEIIETAVNAVNDKGYKLLVLQSGEDDWYTIEKLVEIIKEIKKVFSSLLVMMVIQRLLVQKKF